MTAVAAAVTSFSCASTGPGRHWFQSRGYFIGFFSNDVYTGLGLHVKARSACHAHGVAVCMSHGWLWRRACHAGGCGVVHVTRVVVAASMSHGCLWWVVVVQDDGERYEGEFYNGLREGRGKCTYAPHEDGMTAVYSGTFERGLRWAAARTLPGPDGLA